VCGVRFALRDGMAPPVALAPVCRQSARSLPQRTIHSRALHSVRTPMLFRPVIPYAPPGCFGPSPSEAITPALFDLPQTTFG
jgi:hypothetical protein